MAMRGAQGLGTALSKKRLRVYQHDLPWEFNELYVRFLSMMIILDRQKMMCVVDDLWKDGVEHADSKDLQRLLWTEVKRAQDERQRISEGNEVWEARHQRLDEASRKACDEMARLAETERVVTTERTALARERTAFDGELVGGAGGHGWV